MTGALRCTSEVFTQRTFVRHLSVYTQCSAERSEHDLERLVRLGPCSTHSFNDLPLCSLGIRPMDRPSPGSPFTPSTLPLHRNFTEINRPLAEVSHEYGTFWDMCLIKTSFVHSASVFPKSFCSWGRRLSGTRPPCPVPLGEDPYPSYPVHPASFSECTTRTNPRGTRRRAHRSLSCGRTRSSLSVLAGPSPDPPLSCVVRHPHRLQLPASTGLRRVTTGPSTPAPRSRKGTRGGKSGSLTGPRVLSGEARVSEARVCAGPDSGVRRDTVSCLRGRGGTSSPLVPGPRGSLVLR